MSAVTLILNHAIIVGIVALDQFCKFLVTSEGHLGDFLRILSVRPVWNQGISFGLFDKLHYSNSLFLVLSSIVIAYLYPFALKIREYSTLTAWSMIRGGGLSNLIDRIIYGAVLDFIDIHVGTYFFPVFNIADAAITLGAIMLLWKALLSIKKGK